MPRGRLILCIGLQGCVDPVSVPRSISNEKLFLGACVILQAAYLYNFFMFITHFVGSWSLWQLLFVAVVAKNDVPGFVVMM